MVHFCMIDIVSSACSQQKYPQPRKCRPLTCTMCHPTTNTMYTIVQ